MTINGFTIINKKLNISFSGIVDDKEGTITIADAPYIELEKLNKKHNLEKYDFYFQSFKIDWEV